MYLGKIVEIADSASLFSNPRHPYTEALLAAVPSIDLDLKKQNLKIKGDLPSAIDIPKGCVFYSRCPIREKKCEQSAPQLTGEYSLHQVACFLRE